MLNVPEPLDNEAIYRTLVMESPIPIALLVGRDMVITIANEPQLAVWGKGNGVIGLPLVEALPEMKGQPFLAILDNVFTTGVTFTTDNTPAQMEANGVLRTVYFDFSFKALRNHQGEIFGIIATGIEITEKVGILEALSSSEENLRQLSTSLDQQVQERTLQLQELVHDLQRSNQNLHQFAVVASHDLQEPLRKVQQFADLLRSQYGSVLGGGIRYVERMQVAAGRMSMLIRDLLTYSRITTQREQHQLVSLADVLAEVLTELDISATEPAAQITIGELPRLAGDAEQLGQLFDHLLSNALKFRRDGLQPKIQVQASLVPVGGLPVPPIRSVPMFHRIDVTDNGIGFDEKYLDRMFTVFQRLHVRSDFVGTGIGLAICEKVVTNHGGIITASSRPGQGSTFSVFLPAR